MGAARAGLREAAIRERAAIAEGLAELIPRVRGIVARRASETKLAAD